MRGLTRENNRIWLPKSGDTPESVSAQIVRYTEQLEEAERTLVQLREEFDARFGVRK